MAPPKIKVSRRTPGSIPEGYVLGRVSPGRGDVELLRMPDLARLGVQGRREPGMLAKIPELTILANPGPGELTPAALTLTQVLDFISSTQGSILYRGASGWAALAVGTDGQVLTTHGAGADPTWADSSGGGGVVYADGSVPAGNTAADTLSDYLITSSYTFPAGSLMQYDFVRVTLRGVYSTASGSKDLTIHLFLNSTEIATTGAVTLHGSHSHTNASWEAHVDILVQTTGASGTLEVQGSSFVDDHHGMPNTSAISIDTTVDQELKARFQWSVADPSNTITVRQMIVEHLAGAYTPPPTSSTFSFIFGGDDAMFVDVTSGSLEYIVPDGFIVEGD